MRLRLRRTLKIRVFRCNGCTCEEEVGKQVRHVALPHRPFAVIHPVCKNHGQQHSPQAAQQDLY